MTLILGGSGQVGTALRRLFPDALAPRHRDLDLGDPASLRDRVAQIEPARIINCAAYTGVDAAESDETAATVVNGTAVGALAAVAHDLGIPFVTYSTDYVFAGDSESEYTESSRSGPLNAYGRSKLVGEEMALAYPDSLVIRTSWLLSTTHPNFVTTILARARSGEVRVVNDQWGRPTLVDELAAATVRVLRDGLTGLLHLANPPTTTWFDLAQTACGLAGLDPARVVACSSEEFARPAQRPRHAVLASERDVTMPDWRPGLEAIVREALSRPANSHPAAEPLPD